MERKLVMTSCFTTSSWGLVEMSLLLTDDVVGFDMLSDGWDVDRECRKYVPDIDLKLDYYDHEELLVPLLIAKCPVSVSIEVGNFL